MTKLTATAIWNELQTQRQKLNSTTLPQLFEQEKNRFADYSIEAAELLLDYSKNLVNQETIHLLCQLAQQRQLKNHIEKLISGYPVNRSENRPALHTALRQLNDEPVYVDGHDVIPLIRATQNKMFEFAEQITNGQQRGFSNQVFTDVINIGIGGSHLGPHLVTQALKSFATSSLRIHFVANVDGTVLNDLLPLLNPATTLCIISSKSFTTQETLTNAKTIKNWLLNAAGNNSDVVKKQMIAVTAQKERAIQFGIVVENIFPIWDWIGGRFSLWSAVGLPILLQIGKNNFNQLLAGANSMDQHFMTAPFHHNMPVILALLSTWYINFFHFNQQAIIPYGQSLHAMPAYLQQLHMESLGKNVTQQGEPTDYDTGCTIWGGVGTDSQHTFFQLLHQGTATIPVDFIVAAKPNHDSHEHHALLFAHSLGQSQALMHGQNKTTEQDTLLGNKPSNTILMRQLTPFTLGALLALYEHKVFVQSVIWNINCFDQWGVELGKVLANIVLENLDHTDLTHLDSSTAQLIQYYRQV